MTVYLVQETVTREQAGLIQGATVTVYTLTGALATIYSDAAGTTPITGSVVTTDATGTASYYVASGNYLQVDAVDGYGEYRAVISVPAAPGGAGSGAGTNLTYSATPTGGTIGSSTGSSAAVPLADGTNAGLMAPAQVTKLAGVATGATANQTDAYLLSRANHTGTQALSTLNQSGATTNQVPQWNGSAWVPATVSGGGGSGTVTSVAMTVPTGLALSGSPVTTSGTLALTFAAGYSLPTTAKQTNWDDAYTVAAAQTVTGYAVWTAASQADARAAIGAGTGNGTVTSVGLTAPTGFDVTGSPVTGSGSLALTFSTGYSLPTTASQTQWDTAYTDRFKWDGSATGLVAATGRTSLGLGTASTKNMSSGTSLPTSASDGDIFLLYS